MQGSDRLGKRTAQEIKNPENERWLSPVSIWEALTLHAKKRIYLPEDITAWVARATSMLSRRPFSQLRLLQQTPQHRHFRRNPSPQRRIHIRREERTVIRRQQGSRRLSLGKLLRIRPAQTEVETGNA